MHYVPYGPFYPEKVSAMKGRYWRRDFWMEIEECSEGLSTAQGIYIFSLSFGARLTPWYVGKTCSSSGFRGEVFQGHKLDHYLSTETQHRGYSTLHFLAKTEPNRGRFARQSERARKEIDRLETLIIGMGLTVNESLRNDKKTKFLRELSVPGLLGQPTRRGPRGQAANTLRAAFGLSS